jgi:ATP-binding cassette subfamily B protein/subfamily B ATP-binding cassette protein MsbA
MKTQFRLLRYLWPRWPALVVVLVTMGVGVLIDLARPWPIKLLVDNVLGQRALPGDVDSVVNSLPGPGGSDQLLFWVVVSTVLIFLAANLITMVGTYASVGLGERMTYDVGADMFAHLQRLSLLYHNRHPVGDTIARVTGDPSCVQVFVIGALVPAIQSVVTVVTMFIIMLSLQAELTLLSLLVAPFLILAIRIFSRPMKRRNRLQRDLEGQMMSHVQQTLNAVPVVQAFNREEIETARFRGHSKDIVSALQRATFAGMWFHLFVGLVTTLGTAGIMFLGAKYVLDGKMTVGTVLVFLSYLGSLYGPLNSLTHTGSTLQYAAAQSDRVMEVLDAPIEVADAPDAVEVEIQGHVRYEDVTFGYEDRAVLKSVSLEAKPGEVVAIVGPTGAGKTTLVNLLVRFFDPWEGRVTIDGVDLRQMKVTSLRRQIAIVLQDPFIFPFSIAENIAYGRPGATADDVAAAAIAASASPYIERLPEGYDTVVGERGATLSGGEKQRLSIARAFLKDAPILILDEPTSALDARTEGYLLDALERLMKGRVTFIIAHRLSTIRHADRILVVDDGEIVEQGRHEELVAKDGLYAGLYNQQMDIALHDGIAAAEAADVDQLRKRLAGEAEEDEPAAQAAGNGAAPSADRVNGNGNGNGHRELDGELNVAMFLKEFPVVSETFILRQITDLLDRGNEVDIFAEWREEVSCVHPAIDLYGLRARTRYVESPRAAGYWEMPVRPLTGETWLPGAEKPLQNMQRAVRATPALARCLLAAPRQTMTVLNPAEYGYRAESLSSLYRLAAVSAAHSAYDVLHAHFGPVGDNFRFARELLRAPLVVSFHGYDYTSWPRSEGADVYKRLFATADAITVNSDYAGDRVAELGCPREKIQRLPYAVDLDAFAYRPRSREPGEPVRVLTVARLVEKKGLDDSIRAVVAAHARGLPVHYDVIGEGPERERLEALVDELGAKGFVSLHGARDAAAVGRFMAQAHVFMLASATAADGDQEGTPVSLLEAQATGLPVISTRHSGIPEIVEDGRSGFLVAEHDVPALADRLADLVERPDVCEEMGRHGRTAIEDHHDANLVARQLLEIYREAIVRFRVESRRNRAGHQARALSGSRS